MVSKSPYLIAFALLVLSFILVIIGFATGYWYVSSNPDNLFQSVGLWQACFNGYEHTSDLIGKAYYGCWWIFYNEFYYIRDWIMPPWFKAVQTLMTFGVVFEFLAIILLPISGAESGGLFLPILTCIIISLMCGCLVIAVVIFGVMIGLDRAWMPHWEMNVLGWSYGLVVFGTFCGLFALISMATFTLMRKFDNYKNYETIKKTSLSAQI